MVLKNCIDKNKLVMKNYFDKTGDDINNYKVQNK